MFKGFGSNPSSSNVTKPGLAKKAVAFLRWIYEVEEVEAMEETPLLVEEETPLPVEEVVVCRTCGSPNRVKSTSCVACGEPLTTPLLEETPPAKEETPPTLPILRGDWDKEYPEEWATKLDLDQAEDQVDERLLVANELILINSALDKQGERILSKIQTVHSNETSVSQLRQAVQSKRRRIKAFLLDPELTLTPQPTPQPNPQPTPQPQEGFDLPDLPF